MLSVIVPHLARLLDGLVGPADQELLLPFDPEVRRIIREIGEYGYEWPAGKRGRKALTQCAIEVWNKRHNHVVLRPAPVLRQQPDRWPMIHPDRGLQDRNQLRAAQRPAIPDHPVVDVLNAQAGHAPDGIERIEQLLQIDQLGAGIGIVTLDGVSNRSGGASMPSPGIEIDECDTRHRWRHHYTDIQPPRYSSVNGCNVL